MKYEIKNFENLFSLPIFSETSIKNHIALYQGYVNNTNKLIELFNKLNKEENLGAIEFAESKRRFGWEFNGMRLHELFFQELSNQQSFLEQNSELRKKIVQDFGSYENWEKELKAIAVMRGIGWAGLYFDRLENNIFNIWVNEHDVGHLTGCVPLVVLDVFEHAYLIDYGTKKIDYINSLFKFLNWDLISERFKIASSKN